MKKKNTAGRITNRQALSMLKSGDLLELGRSADSVRKRLHPEGIVSFVVDRNINYTNICINKCRFCAFWRDKDDREAYLLDKEALYLKIEETISLGGTQILIQGGLHPSLDIGYYMDLLSSIKERFDIHIHGFSPPEICYIADTSDLTIKEALQILKAAGLDSVPGGGAEILSDRVREVVSPRKIRSSRWLDVMEQAHNLGMRTTATMMFGSIETPEDIVTHLDSIRKLQDRTGGFTAFIPWSFQPGNTKLKRESQSRNRKSGISGTKTANLDFMPATGVDYLRILALARIYLDNFDNVQASWVTQGLKMAQVALRFGANDFGSTMIEENVVAAAGVHYRVSKDDIINSIRSAGFIPAQRDTCYKILKTF